MSCTVQFEEKANEVVLALPWVNKVNVTMSAQPAQPVYAGQLPEGLQKISNIIAVSSCKARPDTPKHTYRGYNEIIFVIIYIHFSRGELESLQSL
jgi:hypothetical protein